MTLAVKGWLANGRGRPCDRHVMRLLPGSFRPARPQGTPDRSMAGIPWPRTRNLPGIPSRSARRGMTSAVGRAQDLHENRSGKNAHSGAIGGLVWKNVWIFGFIGGVAGVHPHDTGRRRAVSRPGHGGHSEAISRADGGTQERPVHHVAPAPAARDCFGAALPAMTGRASGNASGFSMTGGMGGPPHGGPRVRRIEAACNRNRV